MSDILGDKKQQLVWLQQCGGIRSGDIIQKRRLAVSYSITLKGWRDAHGLGVLRICHLASSICMAGWSGLKCHFRSCLFTREMLHLRSRWPCRMSNLESTAAWRSDCSIVWCLCSSIESICMRWTHTVTAAEALHHNWLEFSSNTVLCKWHGTLICASEPNMFPIINLLSTVSSYRHGLSRCYATR